MSIFSIFLGIALVLPEVFENIFLSRYLTNPYPARSKNQTCFKGFSQECTSVYTLEGEFLLNTAMDGGHIKQKRCFTKWTIILESEPYKNSIISNIITTINNLTSQIYYFEDRLNSKINELKILLE